MFLMILELLTRFSSLVVGLHGKVLVAGGLRKAEGSCDLMVSLRWSRLLAGPVAPWRELLKTEQVCWQDSRPCGVPTLAQSVSEGLHLVERTHAGAVHEELQPMGRTHLVAVCGELQPMRRTLVQEAC